MLALAWLALAIARLNAQVQVWSKQEGPQGTNPEQSDLSGESLEKRSVAPPTPTTAPATTASAPAAPAAASTTSAAPAALLLPPLVRLSALLRRCLQSRAAGIAPGSPDGEAVQ